MDLILLAKKRLVFGKATTKLRKAGFLPAILYGRKLENLPLEISKRDFEKVFEKTGENTLVNLKIEGEGERKVLIHDVAKDFLKNEPLHVDFYEVDLKRKIHAKVPLHFVGISPAVKELGGVLIKTLNELEIEAKPDDLPAAIEVEVSGLKTFNALVRIQDLKISQEIKILKHHPDDVVVSVQAPRTEEELAELQKRPLEAEKAVIESMTKEAETEKAQEAQDKAAKGEEKEAQDENT